ncbi:MAG: hypothetical protein ACLPXM_01910, partial [Terriglobales bacterium]
SRVRRKRQRLPSSLLIENVSAVSFMASPRHSHAETFPIKASDDTAKWHNFCIGDQPELSWPPVGMSNSGGH